MSWTAGAAEIIANPNNGPPSDDPAVWGGPRGVDNPGPAVDLATVLNDGDDATFIRAVQTTWEPRYWASYGTRYATVRAQVVADGPLTALAYSFRARLSHAGGHQQAPVLTPFFTGDSFSPLWCPEIDNPTVDGEWATYTGSVPDSALTDAGLTMADINAALATDDLIFGVSYFSTNDPELDLELSATTSFLNTPPGAIGGSGSLMDLHTDPTYLAVGPDGVATAPLDYVWRSSLGPFEPYTGDLGKVAFGAVSFGARCVQADFDTSLEPGTSTIRVQIILKEDASVLWAQDFTVDQTPSGGDPHALWIPTPMPRILPADWPDFVDAIVGTGSAGCALRVIGLTGNTQVEGAEVALMCESNLILDIADFSGADPTPEYAYPSINGDYVSSRRAFI